MSIAHLPFYHGTTIKSDNGGFPKVLPLEIYMDYRFGLFRISHSNETKDILREVYQKGTLVEGSVSLESGIGYLSPILERLEAYRSLCQSGGLLEIGFGNGTVLNRLKHSGYIDLTGVEPGRHGTAHISDSIIVHYDFFPSAKIDREFSVIFHFGVLEHVENPGLFLSACFEHLTSNGILLFAVPNCEPSISSGDISMFIHEHYSYFTPENIESIVGFSGGEILQVEVVSGMLFITARRSSVHRSQQSFLISSEAVNTERLFWNTAQNYASNLTRYMLLDNNGADFAFYPGVRAMNLLYQIGRFDARLVDDSSQNYSKYLPCLQRQIEPFEMMCNTPPKHVIVCSHTFKDILINKCKADTRLRESNIIALLDLIRI